MSKIIFLRDDPHEVYSRIFKYIDQQESASLNLIGRRGIKLDSRYYPVRIMLSVIGDLLTIISMTWNWQKSFLVREFMSWPYLFFLPMLLLKPGRIVLNINHNLNNRIETLVALPILAHFIDVAFIEPSKSLLNKYPFLIPLNLTISRSLNEKNVPPYITVFCGHREEQWIDDIQEYRNIIERLPYQVRFIGGPNNGDKNSSQRRIPTEEYQRLMGSSVVILLYRPDNYTMRHSGVCLEALLNSPLVCLPRGGLFEHYTSVSESLILFNSSEDLEKQLKLKLD